VQERDVQLRAAELGALEAVHRVARRAYAERSGETVSLACSALCGLTFTCAENGAKYAQVAEADPLLLELCSSSDAEARVS
jgi:hypothetical protein